MYSDGVVTSAIEITTEKFRTLPSHLRKNEVREIFFSKVGQILYENLKKKQVAWERENSIGARIEKSEEIFWQYFLLIFAGKKGWELLVGNFQQVIKSNIRETVIKYCARRGVETVFSHSFLSDFRTLMAHVDLDLVRFVEEKNLEQIINYLLDPSPHIKEVQQRLIRENTQKTFPTFVKAFFDSAKSLFALAAAEAKSVQKKGRTEQFLNSLHALLVSPLPELEMILPTYGESYADCDENDVKIFHDLWKNIGIDSVTIDEEFNDSVAKRILVGLRELPKSEENALRVRCAVPCPVCKCPCELEADHNTDVKKHRTCHQPRGLNGWGYVTSDRLIPDHCPLSFDKNNLVDFKGDGNFTRFREYPCIHPEWEAPRWSEPLRIREYIMYNFNDELAKFFELKPANNIPASYNWNLQEIKNNLSQYAKL